MTEIPSSRFRKCAIALSVASCLSLLSAGAMAAGLGKLSIFSSLGQPLNAEVELSATPDELVGMTARLAPREIFKQAGVEFVPPLNDLRMAVEKRPDGKAVVKLTSTRPVSEPFLDFLVELNWPAGRVIREYTFLLDPPDFGAGKGGSVDGKVVEGVRDRLARSAPSEAAVKPQARRVAPPTRSLAAEAGSAQPEAGQHVVERGETLRKIAAEYQHPGVSLEQMLVALYRNNREAFIGNDINRLKTGVILDLPDQTAAASVTREEARHVYVSAGDFASYRRKLANLAKESAARPESAATQGAGGKITPKVEEKQPLLDPAKDQVKVARADGRDAAKAAADAERIAAEKALEEAQTRVSMLERNVGELQKLLELKNQRLASLESAQVAPVPAQPQVAQAPVVPPAPPAVAAPAEVKPAAETPAAAPTVPSAEAKPVEPPAPAVPPPPVVEKPPVPPKPPVAPPVVEVPPPPGLLDTLLEDPLPLAGGAAALALLAGLMVYRRRRTIAPPSSPTTAVPSSSSFGPNSIFGPVGGQSVDTASIAPHSSEFSQAGPGSIDTDEVDPVAEADVYMAYGRDVQAEEILLEAMLRDPGRLAIHLKLLEIYAERRSLKQFETLAGELYAQTAGLGGEWEKAASMGRKIDPNNPLYGAGEADVAAPVAAPAFAQAPAAQAFDPDATLVVRPGQLGAAVPAAAAVAAGAVASWNEATIALAPGAAKRSPVEALDTLVNPAPMPAVAQSAHVDTRDLAVDDDMSLDFDLGGDRPSDVAAEKVESTPFVDTIVGPEVSDDNALDFDLDGMVGGNSSVGVVSLQADPLPLAPEALDLGSIDFGLDSEGALASPNSDFAAVPVNDFADDGLSFDEVSEPDDKSAPVEAYAPVVDTAADEDLLAQDVNLDEMDFDVSLSDSVFLNEPLPEADFDMNSISLDLDAPTPVSAPAPLSAEPAMPEPLAVVDEPISLDWDAEPEPVVGAASAGAPEVDFDDMGAAEESPGEPVRDERWEEVNTKLDLAKAYEEMGDLEGARELLQEVMVEGTADLAAQAEAMLQRVGG